MHRHIFNGACRILSSKVLFGNACYIYIDDIIIFGATADEYLSNTRKVFERLQEHNILLKLSKRKFGLQGVKYLGHLVERYGIKIDYSKITEIADMILPDCVKKNFVRS